MQHRRLPLLLHRVANVACCLVLVPAVAARRALGALGGTGDVCEAISDCARPFVCVDSRCMCTPLWAHTGSDCSDMSSMSWALTAVLVLVAFYAINALAAAARKGSQRSTTCSGMYELVVLFFRPPQEHGESCFFFDYAYIMSTTLLAPRHHSGRKYDPRLVSNTWYTTEKQ